MRYVEVKDNYGILIPHVSGSSYAYKISYNYEHLITQETFDPENVLQSKLPLYCCIRDPYTRVLSFIKRFCLGKNILVKDLSLYQIPLTTEVIDSFFEKLKLHHDDHITFQSVQYQKYLIKNPKFFAMDDLYKYLKVDKDTAFVNDSLELRTRSNFYVLNGVDEHNQQMLDYICFKAKEFTKKEDIWYKKMLDRSV